MHHTVGDVAAMAGVTVRTLHHYDEIGLLSPSGRSGAGYRQYETADIERLQRILVYRELGFGLEQIAVLLDGDVDRVAHLRRQHELLNDRITRLQRMAATVRRTMEAHTMGISLDPHEMLEVFGDHDPTEHAAEAEQRWGDTDPYRESQRRTSQYSKDDWLRIKAETGANQERVAAALRAGLPADGDEAMDAAEEHRRQLSEWFYDCSYDMHRGLADMYIADPRFTATYEKVAPGLAQYLRDAIHANADRAGR